MSSRNEQGQDTVEVVHEALIHHWQPLRRWLAADRGFRIWQNRLRQDLEVWEDQKRDDGALLRGARLAEAEEQLEAHAAYRRATELDQENADGWNEIEHLLSRKGELHAAESAYRKVAERGKSLSDRSLLAVVYGNLGNVYRIRGELEQAEAMYQKARAVDEALGRKVGMANTYTNHLGIN